MELSSIGRPALAGASILLLSFSATAAVTTFTDRASFEAASGALATENFNSFTTETPFHTTPLNVGGFTLSMDGIPDTDRNFIDIPPPLFTVFDVDGTNLANILITSDSSLFITFDNPILEFGADFAAFQDDIHRTDIIIAGETITPAIQSGNVVTFLGFKSDTAFSTIEFETVGALADGFSIDNVSYSAVPLPAGVWLFGSAVAGLFGVRAKRS